VDLKQPIVLLTGRVEQAPVWQQSLAAWLPAGQEVLRFPEPTPLPYERGPWSSLSRQGRMVVLARLAGGQHPLLEGLDHGPLVVSSARALMQKTLPRRRFLTETRVLRVGQLLELEKTLTGWEEIGYERVSVVERQGQFSRRGGIIDLFPAAAALPVRIELFGNEVDTVRHFDPETQRSMDKADGDTNQILVTPVREALPGRLQGLGSHLEATAEREDSLPSWHDDIPLMLSGKPFPNMEFYLPLIYAKPACLLDYMPADSLVVIDDWPELQSAVGDLHKFAAQIAADQPSLPEDYPNPLIEWETLQQKLAGRRLLTLGDPLEGVTDAVSPNLADAFRPGPRFGGQVRPLMTHLRAVKRDQERTVLVSSQAQRLADLWLEENQQQGSAVFAGESMIVEELSALPSSGELAVVRGSLPEGFVLERESDNRVLLNLLTDAEVFGWKRPAPRRQRIAQPMAPETAFADIKPGDHVVHLEYGIGKFVGLVVRYIGGTDREYLQVHYGNSDMLYVPVHHADRLSKWIGPEEQSPALHRLGERHWKAAKARAERAVAELADELLELYSARETVAGHAYEPDDPWQAELEASFPYQETEDQLQAISDVKHDMERARPMDRLICGDVGYGKTEVALRAAFKAVMDGKQVAMLVPTTVLAQQHYTTFAQRLKTFPVNLEMLSRFRTLAQQSRIIKQLREGEIDIVIGTHRLLSDDVSFKDLGLLIIDEEQRFGVSHKETLKQLRTEVDVLTMTATPIPRTMHMGLSGLRDISMIDTAPADRLPVQTYVGEVDDTLLRRAILRELDRGGQIYFVHNRVQTIHMVEKLLQEIVPQARIQVGHGQMPERALETVMQQFVDGEIDILLSTTIIESGLDIPNANTLIVDRAEMFGLAQLYQLRGRVGRGTRRAYAYFFHGPWRLLSHDAQTRLEAIEEHTELGSGYHIAMRDLEIRGAGDLLGPQQSGHIAAVGFDLYMRMLAQAVRQRKAAKTDEKIPLELSEPTLIDLPLAAYIPTDYAPDPALRLRLYRRMAGQETLADIDELAAELADRFGPIPDPVDNLLYQLRVKVLAAQVGVNSVLVESGQIRLKVNAMEMLPRMHLQRFLGEAVRVSRSAVWFGKGMPTNEWKVLLVQVLEKLGAFRKQNVPDAVVAA
jgi:transcription-repair coupling factor (superfamily II helicase)